MDLARRHLLAAFLPLFFAQALFGGLTFKTNKVQAPSPGPGEQAVLVQFPFRNEGDKTVTISKIETSCGCTVPEVEKMTYPPGASGIIKARFDVGGRQGIQANQITVKTDDGDHLLTFTVDLPQRILVLPRLKILQKNETSQVFTIVFAADTPVKAVSLGDASPNYTAQLVEKAAGTAYEVRVELTKNAATSFHEVIYVRSKGASGIDYVDSFFLRRPEY